MAKEPESAVKNLRGEEILCGFHGVQSFLKRAPAEVVEVLTDERRHDPRMKRLQHELAQAGVNFRPASRDELERLARGVRHQGVIARIQAHVAPGQPELYRLLERLDHHALLLILDQVQDPHNLGACLRTADGAGVDAVIVPKDGACPVNPTVTRVAAGAVGRLPVFYVTNLARTVDSLRKRGIWITGGDDAAERTLYEVDFSPGTAIAIGAEGRGLRRLTRERCDQLVRLPTSGPIDQLNVSNAAAVALYELSGRRAS